MILKCLYSKINNIIKKKINEELKNHWKIELLSHINNIASSKIKNGDSISTKMNANSI